MTIRVVLRGTQGTAPGGAGGTTLARPPGRLLLAHTDHTFADLAEAVDTALGRWDPSPLHEWDVEGRRLVTGDTPELASQDVDDSDEVTLGEVGLRLGSRFTYVFDLDQRWHHDVEIEAVDVDPFEVFGEEPELPVPLFGWGTIPDQYGRVSEDDDAEDLLDPADVAADEEDDDLLAGEDWVEVDLDDDDDDDGWDGNSAWPLAEPASWELVERAVATIERPRPGDAVAAAAERLRAREDNDEWPYDVLWAAGGLDDGDLPEDDDALWLELAAGVASPRDALPLDPETESAWAALEPADWAAAIIELTRAGVGALATPDALIDLVVSCEEVDGGELSAADEELLLAGFGTVVQLWRALGAVDDADRLTALGHWGLPKALRRAWT